MGKRGKGAPEDRCLKDKLIRRMERENLPPNVVRLRESAVTMVAEAALYDALIRSCAACGKCEGVRERATG